MSGSSVGRETVYRAYIVLGDHGSGAAQSHVLGPPSLNPYFSTTQFSVFSYL